MINKNFLANTVLLSVAFVWGSTFVFVEEAVLIFPPLLFNSIRFLAASLLLWVILGLFYRPELKKMNKQMLRSGLLMGIWLATGYALQTTGLVYTTPSKSGFITGLSVALVPVFAYFILHLHMRKTAIIGIFSSVLGMYLLAAGDISGFNLGDLLTLLAAICFALHIVFTGKFAPNYNTLVLAAIQLSTVAVCSILGATLNRDWLLLNQEPTLILTQAVIFALTITALLGTCFAYVAQTAFQKYATPTQVALIFATEPVFAGLSDYVWNGRTLSTLSMIGCLFILAGMLISEIKFGKRRKTESNIV